MISLAFTLIGHFFFLMDIGHSRELHLHPHMQQFSATLSHRLQLSLTLSSIETHFIVPILTHIAYMLVTHVHCHDYYAFFT